MTYSHDNIYIYIYIWIECSSDREEEALLSYYLRLIHQIESSVNTDATTVCMPVVVCECFIVVCKVI